MEKSNYGTVKTTNITPVEHVRIEMPKDEEQRKRAKKTTLMFLVISVVYVLSFLPNPTITIVRFVNPGAFSCIPFYLYLLLNYCIFINYVANSIIYAIIDTIFRTEIKKVYVKICCFFTK